MTTYDAAAVPRSIGRVLDLLEIVIERGRCNLTTAAAAAELTPTTALRHLRALEARGYLSRDYAGWFTAGPTVDTLSGPGTPRRRLITAAQPILEQLAERTGESVYLAIASADSVSYVAWAEGTRAIRHAGWLGRSVSLDGTAVGQALASPGTPSIRHGAVEPDITAIVVGDLAMTGGPVAISVLGPTHRLDGDDSRTVADAALAALASLTAALQ